MAREYRHGAIEIGTEPTLICTVGQEIAECSIQNCGSAPVFVGGSSVATKGEALGFKIKPGEDKILSTYEHDACDLFGVVAEGTAVVVFLVSG